MPPAVSSPGTVSWESPDGCWADRYFRPPSLSLLRTLARSRMPQADPKRSVLENVTGVPLARPPVRPLAGLQPADLPATVPDHDPQTGQASPPPIPSPFASAGEDPRERFGVGEPVAADPQRLHSAATFGTPLAGTSGDKLDIAIEPYVVAQSLGLGPIGARLLGELVKFHVHPDDETLQRMRSCLDHLGVKITITKRF